MSYAASLLIPSGDATSCLRGGRARVSRWTIISVRCYIHGGKQGAEREPKRRRSRRGNKGGFVLRRQGGDVQRNSPPWNSSCSSGSGLRDGAFSTTGLEICGDGGASRRDLAGDDDVRGERRDRRALVRRGARLRRRERGAEDEEVERRHDLMSCIERAR